MKKELIEDIKSWKKQPWRLIVGLALIAAGIYWFIKAIT